MKYNDEFLFQKEFFFFKFYFLAVQEERGPRKSSKVVNKSNIIPVEVPKPWHEKSSVESFGIKNLTSQQQWKEGK